MSTNPELVDVVGGWRVIDGDNLKWLAHTVDTVGVRTSVGGTGNQLARLRGSDTLSHEYVNPQGQ